MKRKTLLLLFLPIFLCGTLFAQEETRIEPPPKNVITLDVGKLAGSLIATEVFNTGSEFSTALILGTAQYERHLTQNWSLAGRLSYSGYFDLQDNTRLMSVSAEGHGRYYPDGGSFYVGGMLGYANFLRTGDISTTPMSHYFLAGGNVGMRIDFDEPGGFIIEPSLGYIAAFGNTITDFDKEFGEFGIWLDRMYDFLVKAFFIGMGPRFTLSFGYRF